MRGRKIIKIIQTKEPFAPSEIPNSKSRIPNLELDSVVLKSLAKSPSERYQTVGNFRVDIEKYLNNQPVSARPNTIFYRRQKYVKRHKFEAVIAAVFALILFGWLVTAILQTQIAEAQARENRRAAYSAEMILAANEYENANLNRLREIVEKYQPRNDDEEDLRGFEWYFLNNLLNPPTKIASFQHPDEVWNAEFSPDGKFFAAYEDGLIKCFDTDSGAEIFSVQASADVLESIAVSPDGKFFASGGNDKLVIIFESETGREIAVLSGNTKPLYKIIFSPDGEFLAAGGADDTARIWRVSDKKSVHEFSGMSAGIFAIAFSPDAKRLATASDVGVIRLWNTESGEQVLAFTASRKQINQLKFSADGKTLISVDADGKMNFWNGN